MDWSDLGNRWPAEPVSLKNDNLIFPATAKMVEKESKDCRLAKEGNYMGRNEDNHVGTAITFLMIGIGAGAIAALLLAPKSGEQLRKDIRRRYEDAREAMEDIAEEAKERVEEVMERGSDWVEEVEESARKRVAPLARALRRD